ncbi:MAG: MarR family winged helix-turn-helix transcriptional regulator [Rhodospirillales bacterium]|nr:MarR family winged helix-turn-helix transcriptional regulator [Rhodospirillales bacterium]
MPTSPDHMPSLESTYEIAENCVGLHMQSAGRAAARHFDDVLRPLSLTNWQFAMLLTLHRAAPVTIGHLAERLAMDRTTAAANLKPLERRGLVESGPHQTDRRVRLVALMDAGRAALADAVELWADADDVVTQGLSDSEVRTLCQTLRRISRTHHSTRRSRSRTGCRRPVGFKARLLSRLRSP